MKFYGELLVFILLLITNIRVFFVEQVKKDPLVSLAPFTFFLAILQIFSWGMDFFIGIGFIISLLVFLSNFHAMFRYSEQLFVDHYSPLMKTWAVFTTLLSSAAILGILFFIPADVNNNKNNIEETKTVLSGTFRTGFEKTTPFKKSNAVIYEYKNKSSDNSKSDDTPLIVYLSDKRSDTQYSNPYLKLLAKENFTVISADFYSKDCLWLHNFGDNKVFRRFVMCLQSISDPESFMMQREFYTYNSKLELEAITELTKKYYEPAKKIFIICDVMGKTAVEDFQKANPEIICGYLSLDSIPEYETPGYGFIQQTDPLLCWLLKKKKDSNFTITKIIIEKTKDAISASSIASEITEN